MAPWDSGLPWRSVSGHARPALLVPQDGQCPERLAKIPARPRQGRPAGDLDGGHPGRCLCCLRSLCDDLRRQVPQGHRRAHQRSRQPADVLRLPPAEHWQHIRTTNAIESTFATVRHRTTRTRNCVSRATFLGLAFKLIEEAEKTWRRINGAEHIELLLKGIPFKDGAPAQDNPPDQQKLAA